MSLAFKRSTPVRQIGRAWRRQFRLHHRFSIFWIYFCEREHLPKRKLSTVLVWDYAHVLIFAAIAVPGTAIAAEFDLITHHSRAIAGVVSSAG